MADFPPAERPRLIAVTANAFTEDRHRCLDAGMDDYLPKPLDVVMLRDALLRCTSGQAPARPDGALPPRTLSRAG